MLCILELCCYEYVSCHDMLYVHALHFDMLFIEADPVLLRIVIVPGFLVAELRGILGNIVDMVEV